MYQGWCGSIILITVSLYLFSTNQLLHSYEYLMNFSFSTNICLNFAKRCGIIILEIQIRRTSIMLTKSQQKVYDYLRSRTQCGLPPTVREICAATGLKSTSSVHAHLKTLEREGYISRDAGLNRAIHLAGEQNTIQVPIVGRVAAGQPILAVENVEGYVPFCPSHNREDEYFALNVRGESMKKAGILDGDIVVALKTPTALDGEIVVALIEDEATVKRLYREKDRVRLQPENDDYEPIYTQNVSVLGKVVAVFRYYR